MLGRMIINSFILYWTLYLVIYEQNRMRVLYALLALLPLLYWFWSMVPPYWTKLKLLATFCLMILVGVADVMTLLAFNSLASIVLEVQYRYPPKIEPDISLSSLLFLWNLLLLVLLIVFFLCVIQEVAASFPEFH